MSSRELLGWTLAATLLVAGPFYWKGSDSINQPSVGDDIATAVSAPNVLEDPQPSSIPQISSADTDSRELSLATTVPVVAEPTQKQVTPPTIAQVKAPDTAATSNSAETATASKPRDSESDSNRFWPVQTVEGASGRLVRIGKFTTRSEAEEGWQTVLRQYPGMQRLPTLPVPIKSLRDGHLYYRLQVGTTSQAHSEVVCERVRNLEQTCTVIGLDEGSADKAT